MNADEINHLITHIEQLQITVNQTRIQLTEIRDRLANEPQPANQAQEQAEENENRSLRIGDRVEILNAVRLRGSLRSSRGVQGSIVRFTGTYVIVRVVVNLRNNVESYQDIRRAPHNIARI